jgi:hypothetical protein
MGPLETRTPDPLIRVSPAAAITIDHEATISARNGAFCQNRGRWRSVSFVRDRQSFGSDLGSRLWGRPYRASATNAESARVSDSVAQQVRDLESMDERLRWICAAAAVLLE